MSAQLRTNAIPWLTDTETVTIVRRSGPDTTGAPTQTTIYSGAADVQIEVGMTFVDPSGLVQSADGTLAITPDSNGNLPAVESGDVVQLNGAEYRIEQVYVWNAQPIHLEARLKVGPKSYHGPR
jgi:hypothetical protein